jgi:hypothetical protein
MGIIKAKVDYSKNGPNDEYYTPVEAVEMIIPYIPKHVRTIWECTAIKESRIVEVLRSHGYEVITSHIKEGKDYLEYVPMEPYDLTVTNPPYSLKHEFLKRGFELKKPFMFLLPITTLEGAKRHRLFREYGIQLIIPDRRFSFKPDGSGAWFQTSWFTHGLKLEKDLNFITVKNSVKPAKTYILEKPNEFRQAA